MGQFDSRAAPDPHPLATQGPHHTGTIGDYQVGLADGLLQFRQLKGGHRHLSVEGDELAATMAVQRQRGLQHIAAGIDGETQHLAALVRTDRAAHGGDG